MNETLRLILTIIHALNCLIVIVTILFQSSKSEGISSALSGTAESFFGKNKARSLDAKLAKVTGISAAIFIVMTFVLSVF